MKHVIVIDDKSNSSKAFFLYAKELAKKDKTVLIDKQALEAIEEVEDNVLVKEMKKAEKFGLASPKEKKAFMARVKKMVGK